jgi:hypothetical protein
MRIATRVGEGDGIFSYAAGLLLRARHPEIIGVRAQSEYEGQIAAGNFSRNPC